MAFDLSHISVRDILDAIDIQEATVMFRATWLPARPNSLTPWQGETPLLGTWRFDPATGQFEILVELQLDQIFPSEPEGDIELWQGYALYARWAREGRHPPPITVVRHVKGHLVSLNRRRVLAAKDAGKKTILAWFSETGPTGRSLWQLPRTQHIRLKGEQPCPSRATSATSPTNESPQTSATPAPAPALPPNAP